MITVRKFLHYCVLISISAGCLSFSYALDNGLAKTPPMGWNSWNCFDASINENQIKEIADAMVSTGLKDVGFIYLNLDDNWMATSRDASGNLRADPTRFPNGMKALGDYIHSKGLKYGIYGDRGVKTCYHRDFQRNNNTESGSYGKETRDAKIFASWGVDYLKYDNCEPAPGSNQEQDYKNMRDALANSGRDIVYSVCAWGFKSWAPETGNLWRSTDDIKNVWDAPDGKWYRGILDIIDLNQQYAAHAKPGAWNDPDMLQVGNYNISIDNLPKPTDEEYRTHFSLWCIMAAPLILGNDIRKMNQVTKDILLNKEVIAIDQDSAGIQGTRVKSTNGLEVWCKPLGTKTGDTKAVALFNRNNSAANITVNFSDIGLSGEVVVRDLWAKADKGKFTNSFTMNVPSHGTGMLKISKASVVNTLKVKSHNKSGVATTIASGQIEISSVNTGKSFSVSVFSPQGRLVSRMNNINGAVSIPTSYSGIYIVDVNCDGQHQLSRITIHK